MSNCTSGTCLHPGLMAIRTSSGGPDTNGLKSTVFHDERDAPSTASRYCAEHGANLMATLVLTLTPAAT